MPDFAHIVLLAALASTYHRYLLAALSAFYNWLRLTLTVPFLMFVYGVILLYLCLSVARLQRANNKIKAAPPRRQKKSSDYVIYYDEAGKPVARIRRDGAATAGITTTFAQMGESPTAPPVSFSAAQPQPVTYARLEAANWDGWPNGYLRCQVRREELETVGFFGIFWSLEQVAVAKRGHFEAVTAAAGKQFLRKCNGVIRCDSGRCPHRFLVAPEASLKGLQHQLTHTCMCGGNLVHHHCGVKCSASVFRFGAIFQQDGEHTHGSYTHRLIQGADSSMQYAALTESDWVPMLTRRNGEVISFSEAIHEQDRNPAVPDANPGAASGAELSEHKHRRKASNTSIRSAAASSAGSDDDGRSRSLPGKDGTTRETEWGSAEQEELEADPDAAA
uniref:C2H2-type domain-containing protein n=1 Tax=Mycena chlorophos TaxID=658473 RepID=A0ABQ0LP74_MYCCL|nr:predicted protein [Mycena chlorophos]